MTYFNVDRGNREPKSEHPVHAASPVYTREAFRAILARHPEWKIRAALEENNIPSPNIPHAIEWLEEMEQAYEHRGYWS